MFDFTIHHELPSANYMQTDITITRDPSTVVFAAAEQRYAALIGKQFTIETIAGLPEVVALGALRAKGASIDADLRRVEIEQKQAQLDQAKLLTSTLAGEKLALALADAEQRQNAAAQRLQAAQSGVRVFRSNLAQAENAARAAIQHHFSAVIVPRIRADHEQAKLAAREQLGRAIDPILIEFAILEQVSFSVGAGIESRVAGQIEQLLQNVGAASARK